MFRAAGTKAAVVPLLLLVTCCCRFATSQETGQPGARDDGAVEGRGRLRKMVLPMLMGVVLKASTLVPMSLMVLTFLAINALFAAKLAFGVAAAVGAHYLYRKHESGSGGGLPGVGELAEAAANIPQVPPGQRRRHVVKKHWYYS